MDGAAVYQIYPRSFFDSNGDGVGDLPGIIGQLDYLANLGITAIWLSPFYPSPMADFGYDIKDYCDVEPLFGTLDNARQLFAQAHRRHIKVLVDLVPNHTSDEHAWFIASSSSRTNPKHDWYIWRDAAGQTDDGKPLPPNNWVEVFSGESAWQWHDGRQQFYMHSFNVHQPDLNWENPAVRQAMQNVMRFWLDLGVDGFRVDAVNFIAKDQSFADDPPNPRHIHGRHPKYNALRHVYSQAAGQLFNHMSSLTTVLQDEAYASRQPFMVSEAYPQADDRLAEYFRYYRALDPAVAAPFNFEGLELDWQAANWRLLLERFQAGLLTISPDCVMSFALGNHDQPRLASRLGEATARSAAVLLLSLPGMAFIYNGDEIGMRNGVIPPELVKDPGASGGVGRDPSRTPMQWSSQPGAGFTTSPTPWLPINQDYRQRNVATQLDDSQSLLSLYRKMLQLRREAGNLRLADLRVLPVDEPDILAFQWADSYLTVVNFSGRKVSCTIDLPIAENLVSTSVTNAMPTASNLVLSAYQATVFAIKPA